MFAMTTKAYEKASEAYKGFCKTCQKITATSGVEPDAEGYTCKKCKQPTVMGIEQALMCGDIDIK